MNGWPAPHKDGCFAYAIERPGKPTIVFQEDGPWPPVKGSYLFPVGVSNPSHVHHQPAML